MKNEDITITELATKLGVDRKKVAYQATKLGDELVTKKNGVLYLKKAAIKVIKNSLSTNISNELVDKPTNFSSSLVAEKELQIELLKSEIISKDNQISELHKLLDQQQLALQDKKLLETYKEDNEQLTALSLPAIQKEQQAQVELERLKDEVHFLQEQLAKKESKKWYHFFKK
jgi:hypothetical protein